MEGRDFREAGENLKKLRKPYFLTSSKAVKYLNLSPACASYAQFWVESVPKSTA